MVNVMIIDQLTVDCHLNNKEESIDRLLDMTNLLGDRLINSVGLMTAKILFY